MIYEKTGSVHSVEHDGTTIVNVWAALELDHHRPASLEVITTTGRMSITLGPVALRELAGMLADLQAGVEQATAQDDWEEEQVPADMLERVAGVAARMTPPGCEPGSLDAIEWATAWACRTLDSHGYTFTYADLQDAVNAAQ